MKFANYCTCGAKWAGSISPRVDYEKLKAAMWDAYHSGPGHEAITAAKAGYARRTAENKIEVATQSLQEKH